MIWYVAGVNVRHIFDGKEMVLWVAIRRLKSSSVGAFTWSSLRWFQSVVVGTKKERVLVLFGV